MTVINVTASVRNQHYIRVVSCLSFLNLYIYVSDLDGFLNAGYMIEQGGYVIVMPGLLAGVLLIQYWGERKKLDPGYFHRFLSLSKVLYRLSVSSRSGDETR